MSDIPNPITRKDQYLSYLTGNTDYYPKDPITREEQYLYYLCVNGGIGGNVTPEQIQQAVDAYLEENPVQPGATEEQAAQIEKNKTDISELSEDILSIAMETMEDIPVSIESGYYKNDGTFVADNYYHVKFSVKPYEKYEIRTRDGFNIYAYLILNDNDVVNTSGRQESVENRTYTIDVLSGQTDIIVNSYTNVGISIKKRILKSNFDVTDIPDDSIKKDQLEKYLSDIFFDKYSEIEDLVENVGYVTTDGDITDYDSCKYIGIDVNSGEKYLINSTHGINAKMYVIADDNGTVIEYYPSQYISSVTEETKYISIPKNGKKLYVNTYLPHTIKISKQIEYSIRTMLYKKKIVFFGDSLTANTGSWADATTIAQNNEMYSYNLGVGGSKYTVDDDSNNTNCILRRIESLYNTYSDSDYVILSGIANDAFQSSPMGELLSNNDYTSEPNERTFSGAFEKAIRFSIINWKGKKIGFILLPKISSAPELIEYNNVAKQILEKYSVPYIDLYNISGLNPNIDEIKNTYYFSADGTHPTPEAYALYINNKVESWIKSL